MTHQDNAEQRDEESNEKALSPFIEAYINEQIQDAIKQQEDSYPKKKKWRNAWRSASPITKASLILTAAVAAATIGYAIIAWRTLGTMRRISEDNAAQTQKLIEATDEMKSAGWTFSGAAIGINNAGWNAVGKLQEQANQVKRSATAAEDAVRTTQDQMRLDQKAWLAIKDMNGPPSNPKATFTNTGHTPALEVEAHVSWQWTSDPPPLINPQEYVRLGLVSPETERTLNIKAGPEQTNKPLYAWGVFTYRDIFRTCHWVSLCFRLSDDRTQYEFCQEHNDTDKNDETPTKLTNCPIPGK
jgi:hypothetical protein